MGQKMKLVKEEVEFNQGNMSVDVRCTELIYYWIDRDMTKSVCATIARVRNAVRYELMGISNSTIGGAATNE